MVQGLYKIINPSSRALESILYWILGLEILKVIIIIIGREAGGLTKYKEEGRSVNLLSSIPGETFFIMGSSDQIRSVAQSCPTLCKPMNRSTPGLPVHHQLPEFTQTHVHRVSDAIQPSHPLSSPSPPVPNPSQRTYAPCIEGMESYPLLGLSSPPGKSSR